jgi:hypothetical protein
LRFLTGKALGGSIATLAKWQLSARAASDIAAFSTASRRTSLADAQGKGDLADA